MRAKKSLLALADWSWRSRLRRFWMTLASCAKVAWASSSNADSSTPSKKMVSAKWPLSVIAIVRPQVARDRARTSAGSSAKGRKTPSPAASASSPKAPGEQ